MKAAVFFGSEPREARHQAEAWCKARGISVGTLEGPRPRGLMVGNDVAIAKWTNLRQADRDSLDGVMRGDMRYGPIEIWLDEARVDLAKLEAQAGLLPTGAIQ